MIVKIYYHGQGYEVTGVKPTKNGIITVNFDKVLKAFGDDIPEQKPVYRSNEEPERYANIPEAGTFEAWNSGLSRESARELNL